MHDFFLLQIIETLHHLSCIYASYFERKTLSSLNKVRQVPVLAVFEDEVEVLVIHGHSY